MHETPQHQHDRAGGAALTSEEHERVALELYVVRSNERVTLRQRARGKRSRFRGIALGRLRPTSIFSRGGSRPDELPDDYDLASQNLFAGTGATSLGS